ARAVLWSALWDMTRDAQLPAHDFTRLSLDNIDVESDPVLVSAFIARMWGAIEEYGNPKHRAETREVLASGARERAMRAPAGGDLQLLWAQTFIEAARRPSDVELVRSLLDEESVF